VSVIWRKHVLITYAVSVASVNSVKNSGNHLPEGWGLNLPPTKEFLDPPSLRRLELLGVDSNPSSSYCYWLSLACTYGKGYIIMVKVFNARFFYRSFAWVWWK